ncbi:hypothetical protein ACFX2K_032430 [Malus domestica]
MMLSSSNDLGKWVWVRLGKLVCLGVGAIGEMELPLHVTVLPRNGGEGGRVQEGGGDAALASGWTDLGVPGCGCDRGNGVREREFEREIELRIERE